MKKNVRAFLCLFGAILVLCLVWNAIAERGSYSDFIYGWFAAPFLFYIPLAIGTVGILLWIIGLFFENGVQKKLRISASVAFTVAVLCILTASYVLGKASLQESALQKCDAIAQKYQTSALVAAPLLTENTEYGDSKPKCVCFGDTFTYYTEKNFRSEAPENCALTMEIYEFEHLPRMYQRRVLVRLNSIFFDRYPKNDFFEITPVSGTENGAKYTYASAYKPSENGSQRMSYFVILVEKEDRISLVMLHAYYKIGYRLDIPSIVSQMYA